MYDDITSSAMLRYASRFCALARVDPAFLAELVAIGINSWIPGVYVL